MEVKEEMEGNYIKLRRNKAKQVDRLTKLKLHAGQDTRKIGSGKERKKKKEIFN